MELFENLRLLLLDELGYLFVILSANCRYYSSTIGPSAAEAISASSTPILCTSGTDENVTGIRSCRLCSADTKLLVPI
ncbi:unnamed protein product [Adineta ricciae]|uniref:Uncharacterized protein n=1 Tax=Adineta ricciae TaxID=249248 RepID=A0A816E839_ADIRI|nr:unnamed protein product [Adineta ricciae]CAF1643349.1 unnamed protein product [Adineta ricciae]